MLATQLPIPKPILQIASRIFLLLRVTTFVTTPLFARRWRYIFHCNGVGLNWLFFFFLNIAKANTASKTKGLCLLNNLCRAWKMYSLVPSNQHCMTFRFWWLLLSPVCQIKLLHGNMLSRTCKVALCLGSDIVTIDVQIRLLNIGVQIYYHCLEFCSNFFFHIKL